MSACDGVNLWDLSLAWRITRARKMVRADFQARLRDLYTEQVEHEREHAEFLRTRVRELRAEVRALKAHRP